MNLNSLLPQPKYFREAWEAKNANTGNWTIPTSVPSGHAIALSGPQPKTTCDGIRFNGAATSNVNFGAIHNAATKIWISLRFKLDADFDSSETTDQVLIGKIGVPGNTFLEVLLEQSTGTFQFRCIVGGVWQIYLTSVENSWVGGQWYHVLVSTSNTPTQRLIIDGGTPVTSAVAGYTLPAAGDFVIGDRSDPGSSGFKGIITDIFVGTDDLTTTEEDQLYKGIPPSDTVNIWHFNEGKGTVSWDRITGNNGTLDSSCVWAFEHADLACLDFRGMADSAIATPVSVAGDLSLIWVGKAKSTYNNIGTWARFFNAVISGNDYVVLESVGTYLQFTVAGSGTAVAAGAGTFFPAIDDYFIMIGTVKSDDEIAFYINGDLKSSVSGQGPVSSTLCNVYLGSTHVASNFDVSRPILVGLVEGCLTPNEVRTVSRKIDQRYGLEIGI